MAKCQGFLKNSSLQMSLLRSTFQNHLIKLTRPFGSLCCSRTKLVASFKWLMLKTIALAVGKHGFCGQKGREVEAGLVVRQAAFSIFVANLTAINLEREERAIFYQLSGLLKFRLCYAVRTVGLLYKNMPLGLDTVHNGPVHQLQERSSLLTQ